MLAKTDSISVSAHPRRISRTPPISSSTSCPPIATSHSASLTKHSHHWSESRKPLGDLKADRCGRNLQTAPRILPRHRGPRPATYSPTPRERCLRSTAAETLSEIMMKPVPSGALEPTSAETAAPAPSDGVLEDSPDDSAPPHEVAPTTTPTRRTLKTLRLKIRVSNVPLLPARSVPPAP